MHPQYLSTQYALRRHRGQLAGKKAIPLISVQHHHAHIAACMAENGVSREVIGLACDGVGFGDDGAVWGCEILRADFREYTRLGHLRYTPLVGADAAAEQTYRPAFAALYDAYGPECLGLPIASRLGATGEQLSAATEMIRGEVNSPPSSSLGRWFDATAAMTGVATMNRFEGEAPMMLEAAIVPGVEDAYAFEIVPAGEGPFTIDLRSMVRGIVADTDARIASGVIAAKFHNTVAEFLAASARRVREQSRLDTVAISGGCFANRYLTARLTKLLGASGFSVIRHKTVPAGDGAVALGQAVVAAAKLAHASSNSAATMSARKEHV
jgi:hydrogenase maturation protein HypF